MEPDKPRATPSKNGKLASGILIVLGVLGIAAVALVMLVIATCRLK